MRQFFSTEIYLFTFLGQGIYLHVITLFSLHQLESQDLFPIFHLLYNFTTNVSLKDTTSINLKNIHILIHTLTAISTGRYCSLSNMDTPVYRDRKEILGSYI